MEGKKIIARVEIVYVFMPRKVSYQCDECSYGVADENVFRNFFTKRQMPESENMRSDYAVTLPRDT